MRRWGPHAARRGSSLTPTASGPTLSKLAASLASLTMGFKRLTKLGFPRRFPIVQFPNVPLIVAFLAGGAGGFLRGTEHSFAASVSYLALTIWAYEELVRGANWFRRLLGLAFAIILVVRVAHALQS
jgi:hypothetical protein